MTAAASVESLGSIFADPIAYADPEHWRAAAKRVRDESPILQVLPDFPRSGPSRSTPT